MGLNLINWAFLSLALFANQFVCGLYFPTSNVNLSLPNLRKSPSPLPPLFTLNVLPQWKRENTLDVTYEIASGTFSGLFFLDGDKVRINKDLLYAIPKGIGWQKVTVRAYPSETEDFANVTLNLFLTEGQLNCEQSKENLCFWNRASFRAAETENPVQLGPLSSDLYTKLCNNYVVSYDVIKGDNYVQAKKGKGNSSWMLSTVKNLKGMGEGKIRFAVNCTVTSSGGGTESFFKDFDLTVFGKEKLEIFIETNYKATTSSVIHQGEKIYTWLIHDSSGRKLNLKFSLRNDTDENFSFECSPEEGETFHYECELKARKTIYLDSEHVAVAEIEDVSLRPDHPSRFYFKNIKVSPHKSKFQRLSASPSAPYPEENFMMHFKYPDYVEISRKAVVGTRVTEPIYSSEFSTGQLRKRLAGSKIRFEMLTPGTFNVTSTGGIIYVSNRNSLKDIPAHYRVKIIGVHGSGYRFFSTIQINVTETRPPPGGNEICGKFTNESSSVSCSEKRSRGDCVKTCGVSTGILKASDGKDPPFTVGCSWRSNENPQKLSKMYETCSPDLLTCPDRFCDSLESMFPKICPQDCTEYVFGSANKENDLPGIASATGVCTCDNRQKCLCSMISKAEALAKQNERRKLKQINNDTAFPKHPEVISAMKASNSDNCGSLCLLTIGGGAIILICGTFAILLVMYRRRVKKRCLNQGPLKDDMVNINYEEYVERPGDLVRPLTQNATIKEIPEYYDKKWEFPRYRLTIEEIIGEGEFGKVLKARADGIGGNLGSTIVAVKTLKENAKDSELMDLISEYQLLKEIDHPNVIHLLGACTKLDGPVYIIIEYAKHGSLRNYLRKHRYVSYEEIVGKGISDAAVTPKDILTFAWQIAKGMNYLTDMKLVHRDLAARNVLVADGLICKISDFGLTRDIYEDDTYLKRSKGRVPVKWMALESLADHIYTTKSDVWSYGVVLWELVTTGASPYPGIAAQNLFHLLKSGYRMEKPPNCSSEFYQILRSCWQENPSHRPTFKSLVAKFEEMLVEGKDYLDLNPRTVENKTYFTEFLDDDDVTESFLTRAEGEAEIFKAKFEKFEKLQLCNKCLHEKCTCETEKRYENEKLTTESKPRYENDGMEDSGYVRPTCEPKPI